MRYAQTVKNQQEAVKPTGGTEELERDCRIPGRANFGRETLEIGRNAGCRTGPICYEFPAAVERMARTGIRLAGACRDTRNRPCVGIEARYRLRTRER